MSEQEQTVEAFKGFDKDLKCRGFAYAIGESFNHVGKVEACKGGFHACEYPLDVFNYYAPASSRFAVVELAGEISRDGSDSKIAAAKITVKAELKIPDLVSRTIALILSRIDPSREQTNTGDYSAASNTGNQSAASNTGNQSAASNTGYRSAASNTGYQSAASNTGHRSAASNTGDYSAASNTGNQSAASNTGYQSAASNTGHRSAASNTGDYSAASVEGKDSVAMASGYQGRAKASLGSAIVLAHRDDAGKLIHIRAAIAGTDVKPDTWYSLNANGEFFEVKPE